MGVGCRPFVRLPPTNPPAVEFSNLRCELLGGRISAVLIQHGAEVQGEFGLAALQVEERHDGAQQSLGLPICDSPDMTVSPTRIMNPTYAPETPGLRVEEINRCFIALCDAHAEHGMLSALACVQANAAIAINHASNVGGDRLGDWQISRGYSAFPWSALSVPVESLVTTAAPFIASIDAGSPALLTRNSFASCHVVTVTERTGLCKRTESTTEVLTSWCCTASALDGAGSCTDARSCL